MHSPICFAAHLSMDVISADMTCVTLFLHLNMHKRAFSSLSNVQISCTMRANICTGHVVVSLDS